MIAITASGEFCMVTKAIYVREILTRKKIFKTLTIFVPFFKSTLPQTNNSLERSIECSSMVLSLSIMLGFDPDLVLRLDLGL